MAPPPGLALRPDCAAVFSALGRLRSAMAALLYGCYGYTGKLILRYAKETTPYKNLRFVVAGRDEEKVRAVFEANRGMCAGYRVFGLDDDDALDAGLKGVNVCLHIAGPYALTYGPMVKACVRNGVHYLDVNGEIDVIEGIAREWDAPAKARGVTLCPAFGYDVVPSDVLCKWLATEMPDATHLRIGFHYVGGGTSRGTSKTMLSKKGKPQQRVDGAIVDWVQTTDVNDCFFGYRVGMKQVEKTSWADTASAYYTTGIGNIETYLSNDTLEATKKHLAKLMGKPESEIPEGPEPVDNETGRTYIWGQVRRMRADGTEDECVEAIMETQEAYKCTALSVLFACKRMLRGEAAPGFQTPGSAYGMAWLEQPNSAAMHRVHGGKLMHVVPIHDSRRLKQRLSRIHGRDGAAAAFRARSKAEWSYDVLHRTPDTENGPLIERLSKVPDWAEDIPRLSYF